MIKDSFLKLKEKNKKDQARNVVMLCKYFGWSLQEVLDLPIPAFFELIKIINEIEKEQSEEAKTKHGPKT